MFVSLWCYGGVSNRLDSLLVFVNQVQVCVFFFQNGKKLLEIVWQICEYY